MRILRFFAYLLASACLLLSLTWAQPPASSALAVSSGVAPLVRLSQRNTNSPALPLMVHVQASADMTVEQIAASPAQAFVPFNPQASQRIDARHPLWLHFRVAVEPDTVQTGWTFEIPKPLLNCVEFYFRNPQGQWQEHKSGIAIPHAQWPQHGLYPQFQLPLLGPGEHDFYVKVEHNLPARFAARLLPNNAANTAMQSQFLSIGLILGLMLLMAVITGMYAIVYKDTTYGWYALYVLLGIATCATYVGVANHWVSSSSSAWPEALPPLFLLAAFAVQLQFCRAMFVPAGSSRLIHTGVPLLLVLSVVAMGLLLLLGDMRQRELIFAVQSLLCIFAMFTIALRALRKRERIAWLWLLAYAPLVVVVALTILENFGWAAVPWLPYMAPLYALVFEMLVLLVALHLHAKTAHSRDVRSSTLASTNPLTGFVAAPQYPDVLAQQWLKALNARQDLSVVYVRATVDNHERTDGTGTDKKRNTLRTVRLLRTIAREDDTIAHLDGELFAILMPMVSQGEALASKLSRLVALGKMADKDDRHAVPIQFKILAGSLMNYRGAPDALHDEMLKVLRKGSTWAQRSIQYYPDLLQSRP